MLGLELLWVQNDWDSHLLLLWLSGLLHCLLVCLDRTFFQDAAHDAHCGCCVGLFLLLLQGFQLVLNVLLVSSALAVADVMLVFALDHLSDGPLYLPWAPGLLTKHHYSPDSGDLFHSVAASPVHDWVSEHPGIVAQRVKVVFGLDKLDGLASLGLDLGLDHAAHHASPRPISALGLSLDVCATPFTMKLQKVQISLASSFAHLPLATPMVG